MIPWPIVFSVHLRLMKGKGGEEVVPVLWEDNYFELMPGEKREIAATYRRKQLGRPYVTVDGWNVPPTREYPGRAAASRLNSTARHM